MLEVVRADNPSLFKVKSTSGPLPKKLRGVYTSHRECEKALELFSASVRSKAKKPKKKKMVVAEPKSEDSDIQLQLPIELPLNEEA
jgi:hypothetical protein